MALRRRVVWQKKQEQLCLLPLHYDLETVSTVASFSFACLWISMPPFLFFFPTCSHCAFVLVLVLGPVSEMVQEKPAPALPGRTVSVTLQPWSLSQETMSQTLQFS